MDSRCVTVRIGCERNEIADLNRGWSFHPVTAAPPGRSLPAWSGHHYRLQLTVSTNGEPFADRRLMMRCHIDRARHAGQKCSFQQRTWDRTRRRVDAAKGRIPAAHRSRRCRAGGKVSDYPAGLDRAIDALTRSPLVALPGSGCRNATGCPDTTGSMSRAPLSSAVPRR
jgi:hypothetical protein